MSRPPALPCPPDGAWPTMGDGESLALLVTLDQTHYQCRMGYLILQSVCFAVQEIHLDKFPQKCYPFGNMYEMGKPPHSNWQF